MLRTRIVSVLVFAGIVAGLGYALWQLVGPSRGTPLLEAKDVPRGDQEVAWIHLATESATWERFVESIAHARRVLNDASPRIDLEIDDQNAFPAHAGVVPEIGLRLRGLTGALWIRYYKLTSETNARYWVNKLAERKPAPLAIIGGSSSDLARDLSRELRDQKSWQGQPPVFLISNATSDRVATATGSVVPAYGETEDLMGIYRDRSFRFCFTNTQMAEAVLRFVWSQEDLKPSPGPVFMVSWRDDPYSQDLVSRFYDVFWPSEGAPRISLAEGSPPWRQIIPYSMGGFSAPNAHEAEKAEALLDRFGEIPERQQALLVLPAATQPARRFLRALVQAGPSEVHKFVVVTGDYIDFNTVCRDRNFAWPIHDLPLRLVFFCHRNPVEADAGFKASLEMTSSSTNDLLLYSEMAQTLVRVALHDQRLATEADTLRDRLRALTRADGELRFAKNGDLRGGYGEYVVLLLPQRNEHERVQPWSLLRVYRRAEARGGWERVDELRLSYTGRAAAESGRTPP
jgi:hypothetical protein